MTLKILRTLKTIRKSQLTMHQQEVNHLQKQDRIVSKASSLRTFWMT